MSVVDFNMHSDNALAVTEPKPKTEVFWATWAVVTKAISGR